MMTSPGHLWLGIGREGWLTQIGGKKKKSLPPPASAKAARNGSSECQVKNEIFHREAEETKR